MYTLDQRDVAYQTGIPLQRIQAGDWQAAAASQASFFQKALAVEQDPSRASSFQTSLNVIRALQSGQIRFSNQSGWAPGGMVGFTNNVAQSPAAVFTPQQFAQAVSLPHPDASNQELGPNLGGSDAVTTASDAADARRQAATAKAGAVGVGIIVVGLVILVLFGGKS